MNKPKMNKIQGGQNDGLWCAHVTVEVRSWFSQYDINFISYDHSPKRCLEALYGLVGHWYLMRKK